MTPGLWQGVWPDAAAAAAAVARELVNAGVAVGGEPAAGEAVPGSSREEGAAAAAGAAGGAAGGPVAGEAVLGCSAEDGAAAATGAAAGAAAEGGHGNHFWRLKVKNLWMANHRQKFKEKVKEIGLRKGTSLERQWRRAACAAFRRVPSDSAEYARLLGIVRAKHFSGAQRQRCENGRFGSARMHDDDRMLVDLVPVPPRTPEKKSKTLSALGEQVINSMAHEFEVATPAEKLVLKRVYTDSCVKAGLGSRGGKKYFRKGVSLTLLKRRRHVGLEVPSSELLKSSGGNKFGWRKVGDEDLTQALDEQSWP
eukprot:2733747-Lingulodinium_polyedra.AAC.1